MPPFAERGARATKAAHALTAQHVHVSTKAAALAKAKASQATLDSLLQLGGKGKEGECEEMEEMEEESGGDVKAAAGSASKGTAPKASVSASAPPMLFLQQVCVGG